MKKLFVFGMTAIWLLNTMSVQADVIWEPRSEYYEEHASECVYNNRSYTAEGPNGVVKVYVSPENATVVDIMENGTKVYISFTYVDDDGIEWGVVENYSDESKTGWVPMDYMEVVYDYISFSQEYAASIVEENGVLPEEYAGQTVKFWAYPSAWIPTDVTMPAEAADLPQYGKTFVDEKGLKWGYIGYFYGMKNMWVCLDNPVGTLGELYPMGIPARDIEFVSKEYVDGVETGTEKPGVHKEMDSEEDQIYEDIRVEDGEQAASDEQVSDVVQKEIVPKEDNKLVYIVGGLVAAVVAVTGGLLVWLKKKKK